eukprot:3660727-Pleurochrysis_carterae.AAC.2
MRDRVQEARARVFVYRGASLCRTLCETRREQGVCVWGETSHFARRGEIGVCGVGWRWGWGGEGTFRAWFQETMKAFALRGEGSARALYVKKAGNVA